MSYRAPREKVGPEGSAVEVRGLTLSDVSALLREHRQTVETLYANYSEKDDLAGFAEQLLLVFPELAVAIIRCATDDPEGEWDRLPAGLAVAILESVGRLTFEAGGGVGKVLGVLVSAVEGTSNALTHSTAGSEGSGDTPAS